MYSKFLALLAVIVPTELLLTPPQWWCCFPPLVLSLARIFPPICCCCSGSRPHSWSSARRSCSMCSLLSGSPLQYALHHTEFCPHLLKNGKLHLPKSSGNNTSTACANNGSTERVTRAILVKWNPLQSFLPLRDPTLTTLPCTFLCSKPWFFVLFLWKWVRWKPHRLTRFSFFLPWFHTVKAKNLENLSELISVRSSTRNQSFEQSLKLINLEALFLTRGLQYGMSAILRPSGPATVFVLRHQSWFLFW